MTKVDSNTPVGLGPTAAPKAGQTSNLASLPESVFPGDPVAAALALVAKFSRNSRDLNRKFKRVAVARKLAAQTAEVKNLRKKADQLRSSGIVQASIIGASAGMQAVSLGCKVEAHSQLKTQDVANRAAGNATTAATREAASSAAEAAKHSASLAGTWGDSLAGFGTATMTAAGPAQAFGDANVAITDAEAKAAGNEADRLQAIAEENGDDAKECEEVAQKAFSAIKAVFDAKHSAEMAALNRLA